MDCSTRGFPVLHNSQSLLKLMSIESVMPSNHLAHPLSPPSPLVLNLSQHQSLPVSQFSTSGGQGIGVSASVFPMNIQGWLPLGLTRLISLQSKGLSRVFSNITVPKHQLRTLVRTLITSETFSSGSWDPTLEGQTRGHFQEHKSTYGFNSTHRCPQWCKWRLTSLWPNGCF